MLDNRKLFSFTSSTLVCDNLDDEINIGLTILKQLNFNMNFSKTGPIIFNFDSCRKQSIAKDISSKHNPPDMTKEEFYYNFNN